ncbi:hypothetical protein QNH14_12400 [Apirhabdus apintestini]|nr:hypothetical protein QNH14_12400 [Enterobacteriaceae bacterium CA-0114]
MKTLAIIPAAIVFLSLGGCIISPDDSQRDIDPGYSRQPSDNNHHRTDPGYSRQPSGNTPEVDPGYNHAQSGQLRPGESSVAGKQVDPGFSRAPSNGGKDIDPGYNRKAPGAAGNLDPRFNQHQNGQLRPGESAPLVDL